MTNDGRTIAMVLVNDLRLDQEWRPAQLGAPAVIADIATTTHITLRGRSTDRWYRRHPGGFDSDRRRIWRSVAGGSPAPTSIVSALDAALTEY